MKTTFTRMVATILAIIMGVTSLVGCADPHGHTTEELFGITPAAAHDQVDAAGNDADVVDDNTADAVGTGTTEDYLQLEKALDEANATIEKLNEQQTANEETIKYLQGLIDKAEATSAEVAAEAEAKLEKALAAKQETETKLAVAQKELAAAQKLLDAAEPEVEVIDGEIFCDTEYFLKRATVIFKDNTAAIQATTKGTLVTLDSRHADGYTGNYRDIVFSLPTKGTYELAVTFDGVNAMAVDFAKYSWANRGAFLLKAISTGYPLVETAKVSKVGDFALLLQECAVAIANPKAEYGYDFYIRANYYDPNPTVTVQKPEPLQIKVCGRCDKNFEECICEPEIRTEIKVEVQEKKICGLCNKPLADCKCEPEVITVTETKTEYVDRCGRCGELYANCTCEAEVRYEYITNTEYIKDTEYIYSTITEKWCGRCERLLEDCICGQTGNNPDPTDKDITGDGIADDLQKEDQTTGDGVADDLQKGEDGNRVTGNNPDPTKTTSSSKKNNNTGSSADPTKGGSGIAGDM